MPGHEQRAQKAFLEIRRIGEEAVRYHPLEGSSSHVVGRRAPAQVILNHSSVSRAHAELVLGPFGRWWIHDLGSKNGTYVNGAAATERLLTSGDGVRIGDFMLRVKSSSFPDLRNPLIDSPSSSRLRVLSQPTHDLDEPTGIFQIPPTQAAGRTPTIGAAHLLTVMTLGRELMRVEDPELRLNTLCEFLVGKDFPARSSVVLRLQEGRSPHTLCGPFHDDGTNRPLQLAGRLLSRLWDTREAVLANNTEPVGTVSHPDQTRNMAVVAVPLLSSDPSIDALYVEFPEGYGSEEWLNLVALVAEAYHQAELVWDMRVQVRQAAFIERELEMARQIQEGLVPRGFELEGLEVAVGFEPCRWVGGDYVDALELPDGRVLLAIADVCGKGLQAALVASSLHTLVRSTADTGRSLPDLVSRINDYLVDYLPEHSFVTMLLIALNVHTGELEALSAGHPGAFVMSADGTRRVLQRNENVGLGMMRTEFTSEHTQLSVGDVLLLFTDGLTEMEDQNRVPLGEERLGMGCTQIVSLNPGASLDSMRERLMGMCSAYRRSAFAADDSTFLVARRRPTLLPPPST